MDDISEIAKHILHEAFRKNVTDIHFHPLENNVTIYFRILGKRKQYKRISTKSYQQLLLYFKFSSGMDIGEQNLPQNGTMTININHSASYFLRLSTLPSLQNESLAIRVLPQHEEFTKDNLFVFKKQIDKMFSWFTYEHGLILFSGKTGSGKTTTMYTLLQNVVKEQSFQVITLEHPIEKNIPNIIQVEINENAGLTYEKGLKAVLRHDPDIILVGEILDEYTAKFALHAARTGHIVLSTIHANNTTGTVDRLLSMGINKVDLTQSLIAITSLQLIPIHFGIHKERRAAIAEMLYGDSLKEYIHTGDIKKRRFLSFNQLRKKAYAYGFLSKDKITFSK